MTVLSVYYAPEHARQADRDYIAALQPPVVRILDPDVQQLADVHGLATGAILAPRTWVIDDNNGAAVRNLMADPTGTGRDHAQQYRSQLDGWRRDASSRGLLLPPDNQFMFNAANEPNQGGTPDKICAYNIAFLDRCTELGIRAAALCLGVGWPANTGEGTPVDWTPYAGLEQAILRGDHWMELHEYYYKSGPQDGWGWLAGRHLQCPFAVPIFLGEIGIDNYVDNSRWQVEGGNRGWQGNVSPDVYADMTLRHIQGSDSRIVAAMPFITDYRDNGWQSFDTNPAHNALLSRAAHMIPQGGSGPEPEPPAFERTMYIGVEAGANLRAEPTTASAIVTTIPYREPVKVSGLAVQPDGYAWAMCAYGIYDGWIRSDLLSLTKPQPPEPPDESLSLIWPVQDAVITQRFGERVNEYRDMFGIVGGHNGLDFGAPSGTPIYAIVDGVVAQVGDDPSGYGLYVELHHLDWRLSSFYAHCAETLVNVGQTVRQGQMIAHVGNTGNSTGDHLHWELRCWDGTGYVNVSYGHSKGRGNPELVMWLLGQPPVY